MSTIGRGACGLALVGAACRASLSPAELERLQFAPAAAERLHLEVVIESEGLAGVFDALVVVRPAPPAVRMQLLPELAPPIFDLVATPAAIEVLLPGEVEPRTWHGGAGDPPLAPPLLFGITLLEQLAVPPGGRIVGGHPGAPLTLDLSGAFPGTRIEAAEVADGRVVGRTFRLGYVRWQDRIGAHGGTVTAPGFSLRARVLHREAADDLGADLFQLRSAQ